LRQVISNILKTIKFRVFNNLINLEKRLVHEAGSDLPVRLLSSTYFPEDNRIRDSYSSSGYPVITFASILKYGSFPLSEIIVALLELGSKELGCPERDAGC
jgi:hypothetical protein